MDGWSGQELGEQRAVGNGEGEEERVVRLRTMRWWHVECRKQKGGLVGLKEDYSMEQKGREAMQHSDQAMQAEYRNSFREWAGGEYDGGGDGI